MFQSSGVKGRCEVGGRVRRNFFQSSLFQPRRLRDRSAEFDEIFHSHLSEVSRDCGKVVYRIDEDVAELVEMHTWPGEGAELREVLRYAVLSMEENVIYAHDLPLSFVMKIFRSKNSSDALPPSLV